MDGDNKEVVSEVGARGLVHRREDSVSQTEMGGNSRNTAPEAVKGVEARHWKSGSRKPVNDKCQKQPTRTPNAQARADARGRHNACFRGAVPNYQSPNVQRLKSPVSRTDRHDGVVRVAGEFGGKR